MDHMSMTRTVIAMFEARWYIEGNCSISDDKCLHYYVLIRSITFNQDIAIVLPAYVLSVITSASHFRLCLSFNDDTTSYSCIERIDQIMLLPWVWSVAFCLSKSRRLCQCKIYFVKTFCTPRQFLTLSVHVGCGYPLLSFVWCQQDAQVAFDEHRKINLSSLSRHMIAEQMTVLDASKHIQQK